MQTTPGNLAAILCLVFSSNAWSEEAYDPAARAQAIAPFLDAQSVAAGHVDLTRIDLDAVFDTLQKVAPEAGDLQALRGQLEKTVAGLLESGASELFFVVSLADLPPSPPFLIIPTSARPEDVISRLPPLGRDTVVEPLRGTLFLGSRRTFERVKSASPSERPHLADAFRAAGNATFQLVVVPTEDDRRVVREVMPVLPAEVGGGPSTILTRGVRWLALAVDPPPKLQLRLIVQSEDPDAAGALHAKWQELTRFLSQVGGPHNKLRDVNGVLRLLSPSVKHDQLALRLNEQDGSIQALLATITPPLEQARQQARRVQTMNHLKQLGLAMHNFYDVNKRFPAIGTFDAGGKPLLSWRVHLLPFVDQAKLYREFRQDEPWDSAHNRKLIPRMPETFRSPASKHLAKDGLATLRLVVGEHTAFPGSVGIELKQIVDGSSNTILVAEVDDEHAVTWTKPEGLPFDAENPSAGLGGQFEGGFHCAFCDGSVHFLELPHDPDRLRHLFLRDDRQLIRR